MSDTRHKFSFTVANSNHLGRGDARTLSILLLCLVAAILSTTQASELDPLYFPDRVEWRNIDQVHDLVASKGATMRTAIGVSEAIDGEQALYLDRAEGTAFFDWPSGKWLRLMFDSSQGYAGEMHGAIRSNKTPVSAWFSFGDGLFQKFSHDDIQKQENEGQLQWVIARPDTVKPLIIMLKAELSESQMYQVKLTNGIEIDEENPQSNLNKSAKIYHSSQPSDLKIKLFYSQDSKSPALTTYSQRIFATGDKIRTTQSNGVDVDTWNHTQANEHVSLQLRGPAEYTLHWRSPWYEAYGNQKSIQLGFAIDDLAPAYKMRSMRIDDTHTLDSSICKCVFSRLNSQRIFVKAGLHKVTLTADKEILSYWTRSNQDQQFLFEHNQHSDFDKRAFWTEDSIFPFANEEQSLQAVEISSKLNLDQDAWMKQLKHEAQYFYRDLHQSRTNNSLDYWAIPLKLSSSNQQEFWLPADEYLERSAVTFNQVNAASNAHYGIPKTAHSPPLKIRLLPLAKAASFSLITNNKQIIKMQFVPSSVQRERLKMSARDQVRLQSSAATMLSHQRDLQHNMDFSSTNHPVENSPVTWAPEQFLQFDRPFEELFIYNHSNQKLMVNLSYKNKQRPKTDQYFLLNQMTLAGAKESIQFLSQVQPALLPSFQGHQWAAELKQWHRRVNARLSDFKSRYQLNDLKSSKDTDSSVELLLLGIKNQYGLDHVDLSMLVELLVENNKEISARRLLVQLAVEEPSAQQKEAEQLLVSMLASDERWFDLEGYWAYRLIVLSESRSLASLAQTVFAQNQFDTAYKWYWMHKILHPQFELPTEAILAALKQKQHALVLAMNKTMDTPSQFAWHCWFAITKNQCEQFADLLPKSWQYWQQIDSNFTKGIGKQLIHNQGLDLYFSTWQLNQSNPLIVEIEGPKKLKITWYQNPIKQREQEPSHWPKTNWLDFSTQKIVNGTAVNPASFTLPMVGFQQSVNLTRADADYDHLAGPKQFVIDIEPGLHRLQLNVARGSGLLSLHQLGDLVNELQQDYITFSNDELPRQPSDQHARDYEAREYSEIHDANYITHHESWFDDFNHKWQLDLTLPEVLLDDGFYSKERLVTQRRIANYEQLVSEREYLKATSDNKDYQHSSSSSSKRSEIDLQRPSIGWLSHYYQTNVKNLYNPRVGLSNIAVKTGLEKGLSELNPMDSSTAISSSASDFIQSYFDQWLLQPAAKNIFMQGNEHNRLLSVLRLIFDDAQHSWSESLSSKAWKIQLEALSKHYHLPSNTQQLLRLMVGSYSWKQLTSINQSAGSIQIAELEVKESKANVSIASLLKKHNISPTSQVLRQNQRRTISIDSVRSQKYQLIMQLAQRIGQLSRSAAVLVVVNGEAQTHTIDVSKTVVLLELQKGENIIELSLLSERSESHRVDYDVINKQSFQSIFREKSKNYLASTRSQPLEAFVPPNTLLRIEKVFYPESTNQIESELNRESAARRTKESKLKETRFQYFKNAVNLTLSADDIQYYRLDYLSLNAKAIEDLPTIVERKAAKQALDVLHTYWVNKTSSKTAIFDRYQLGEQDDGSWGFNLSYRDRSNLDEDTETLNESFVELGWEYRLQVPDWNSYFKHQVNYRKHQATDLQTIVSKNDWHYLWSKYWSFDGKLDAYYQLGANSDLAQGRFSLYQSSQVNWRQYWHDDLDNKLSFKVFFRRIDDGFFDAVELDSTTENIAIDDDVFSLYKMQHDRGIVISDTVTYKPWIDTWFRAGASLTTNRDFNLGKPDNLGVALSYRQYFRPLVAKVDLKSKTYFGDEYREKSVNRSYLNLALDWEYWTQSGDLWNFDIFYNQDLTRSNRSFGVRFSWNRTYGQGFDDFSPNEMLFNQLRKRQSYFAIDTNEITTDQHE